MICDRGLTTSRRVI